MTLAPIGPRELKHRTTGIRHIVRSCCHIVLVALLNKELRVLFFKKIQDSKNGFCVSFLGSSIQDLLDHGASKYVTDRRIHSGSGLSGSIAHNDPNDLGMIYLVKKRKTIFGLLILSDLRIQSWIFLKCHCDEISHFFFPLFLPWITYRHVRCPFVQEEKI